jgi:TonB family protein
MPDFPPSEIPNAPDDLNLIFDWEKADFRPEPRRAALFSVLFHVAAGAVLWLLPASVWAPNRVEVVRSAQPERKVTPLVAPRFELTQKTPNKGPVKPEVNLEELQANLREQRAPKTYIPPPSPERRAEPTPKPLEAPPQITPNENRELAQLGTPQLPAPTVQPPVIEPPKKNPFENVGQPMGTKQGTTDGRIPQMRPQTVEELMRQSAKSSQGTSGVVVTDLPSAIDPQQPQNKIGSALELLSDPQGVDFRPYMAKVLAIVRRNWFAVIPESARFGRRGKTMIQFAIARDGKVPKLVISGPSGTEALDRAAVAGISASNPFPPLPSEFKGDVVRLQFAFSYNMP